MKLTIKSTGHSFDVYNEDRLLASTTSLEAAEDAIRLLEEVSKEAIDESNFL